MRRLVQSPSSTPLVSLGTLGLLLGTGLVLVLTGKADKGSGLTLLAIVLGNLPGAIAAIYAERTSRDVRNGVVVDKSRQGAVAALADTQLVPEDNEAVQSARAEIERHQHGTRRREESDQESDQESGDEKGGRHAAPWSGF